MSNELPPDWAIERALDQGYRGSGWTANIVKTYGEETPLIQTVMCFARYIAEHEDAPVDPCVAAGRKLVAETQHDFPDSPWHLNEAAETLAGNRDDNLVVKAAIEGVRRGMELGRAEQ